jgi:hypothetical protein
LAAGVRGVGLAEVVGKVVMEKPRLMLLIRLLDPLVEALKAVGGLMEAVQIETRAG